MASSLRVKLLFVSFFAMTLLLIAPEVLAGGGGGRSSSMDIVKSVSLIGPMGINPFLALSALGIADLFGWTPPTGLQPLTHPAVWISLLILGLVLQFGRSAKLTKPLAEALGTGESFVGIMTVALVMLPFFSEQPGPTQAGLASGLILMVVGLSAIVVIVMLRTALDIMIWLSPFPFVDALFQIVKAILTLGLVAVAILSPITALVLNIILLIVTILSIRWSIRASRFGLSLVWDLSFGRFGKKIEMPRDEVVPQDVGPFDVFVIEVEGVPKRARGTLEMKAERWFLNVYRTFGEPKSLPLGDGNKATFTPGILGHEITLPSGTILLPPRYKHLTEALIKETYAETTDKPPLLGGKKLQQRPQAQATAS